MKKTTYFLIAVVGMLLTGCSHQPQPVSFGQDQCTSCKMTIVDQQHAAQWVTEKGKCFKYDAIECMVDDYSKTKDQYKGICYVMDLEHPTEFIPASTCTFLISDKIPSPMNANLSSFKMASVAIKHQKEYGGRLYSWNDILTQFSTSPQNPNP